MLRSETKKPAMKAERRKHARTLCVTSCSCRASGRKAQKRLHEQTAASRQGPSGGPRSDARSRSLMGRVVFASVVVCPIHSWVVVVVGSLSLLLHGAYLPYAARVL